MEMTSQEQKHSLNVNKPPKQSYKTVRQCCTRSAMDHQAYEQLQIQDDCDGKILARKSGLVS